ncbi:hypothetical protein ONS95_000216 [Cadophora gregata]|uniref:uncharacterized protein n=1 Tax=Cadophora gregata TaxID=51156 RepID=UPI0026DDAFB9|nr:uncharacterized protein ONS95_000216 [Cadophora gregata]KAK0115506.1 hypothetical protein ONS96_013960 [Cadophora gregata f. sp. sojae]KAK0128239.1 hypothetical protein ONS95_000216 [Cadophora gregata]
MTMEREKKGHKGQDASTYGLNIQQLDKMGKFVKFAEIPIELQDKVWKQYVLQEAKDDEARHVHVIIVLQPLAKASIWSKLKTKVKGSSNTVNTLRKYTITVLYAPHSDPPPSPFYVTSRTRSLSFIHFPHKPAIPLPLHGPGNNNGSFITKLIPISFFSNDTLVVTFPFASELFLEFLITCPAINKYVRPPVELMPPGRGAQNDIHAAPALNHTYDSRVLKGAGVILTKRNWLKGGRKEGRSILAFRMCDMGDGMDVNVQEGQGWKVEHRLRGVTIGRWDEMWLRLMECLEIKGKEVSILDLFE